MKIPIDIDALKIRLLERFSEDDSRISEIVLEELDNAQAVAEALEELRTER